MYRYLIQIDVRTLSAKNPKLLLELVTEYIENELGAKQATGTLLSASRM